MVVYANDETRTNFAWILFCYSGGALGRRKRYKRVVKVQVVVVAAGWEQQSGDDEGGAGVKKVTSDKMAF